MYLVLSFVFILLVLLTNPQKYWLYSIIFKYYYFDFTQVTDPLFQPLISILHRLSGHHGQRNPYPSQIYRPGGSSFRDDYDRRSSSESRLANARQGTTSGPTAGSSSSLTPIDVEEEFRFESDSGAASLGSDIDIRSRLRGTRGPDSLASSPPGAAGSRFLDRYHNYRGLSRAASAAATANSMSHVRRRHEAPGEWTEVSPAPSSRPPDLEFSPLDFDTAAGVPPVASLRGVSASSIRDRARYHRPHSAYRDYNYRTRWLIV